MTTDTQQYNFAMQKYILLQEKHEELQAHLQQIRCRESSVGSSSTVSSASVSPIRSTDSARKPQSPGGGRRHSRGHARCSGWEEVAQRGTDLDTILDEDTLYEIYAEQQQLFDVNEGIKRQLTELLNCSAVRSDKNMRKWAQARLMETEKELRSERRRRSSPTMD